MSDSEQANRAFGQTFRFLQTLQTVGVEHVLISPGSRSTPLALAAALLPKLNKKVILDERSAGFTALGIGKATGRPAALISTSGTAVANYFPAVIEAKKSGVPLLLLTADRPEHLHHTGANQTINQKQIFGDYPVFFQHIRETNLYEENEKNLTKLAAKSVDLAREKQGPVHLNFPFCKPLEPTKEFMESIQKEVKMGEQSFKNKQRKNYSFEDHILDALNKTERPVVIIGQLGTRAKVEQIFHLAEQLNLPVLSEQGIENKKLAIEGFEGFLHCKENQARLEPDLILRFGRQPASKSLLLAIKQWSTSRHIYFSDTGQKSDINQTTSDFIHWNGGEFNLSGISQKTSEKWLKQWKETERGYFTAASKLLENQNRLADGHIYHQLAAKIPEDWNISISNSFPARDHSMFGRWKNQKLFTNRGVSGIDGITSTAMGVNIGSEKPGILFTGDLAFLHNAGALLNHRKIPKPLVIVVINNRGGSIFRMLPVSAFREYFEHYFETPQQANISRIAESYEVNVEKIETVSELEQLNFKELTAESDRKVSVVECRTDPEASMEIRKILWDKDYATDD